MSKIEEARETKKSRADIMTSRGSLQPSNNGIGYLNSIWNIPKASSYHHNRGCQGNTIVESSASLLLNNANSDTSTITENSLLYELFSLENQVTNLSISETLPFVHNTPTSGLDSLLSSKELNIPWNTLQFPNSNQEEQKNLDNSFEQELSWSQIASHNSEIEYYSSRTLTEDITNESLSTVSSVRYISDSKFAPSLSGTPTFSLAPPTRPYTVLKIQNIPWYSSTNEIKNLLKSAFIIPSDVVLPLNVHIIMDRHTGKTTGIAFAEVIFNSQNPNDLRTALKKLEKTPLQGRRLKINLSDYDQLREKLFYNWSGQFKKGIAISSTENSDLFICQKDFQSIQNICKNFKLCYNRQCPERAFEYIMSIILNIPWLQKNTVLTWQRDLMYENFKLATDTLRFHIAKPLHTIDDTLLSRFIRVFIICEGFTVKQKLNILKTSKMECPEDLSSYVTVIQEDPLSIID